MTLFYSSLQQVKGAQLEVILFVNIGLIVLAKADFFFFLALKGKSCSEWGSGLAGKEDMVSEQIWECVGSRVHT